MHLHAILNFAMASSTRETILKTLRTQGKCTIKDLAEAAEISPVSVRHHIANLQADNLLSVEESRKGVGRPVHLFSLSEKGAELFPGRYLRLTNRLLEELKGSLPEDKVRELFSSIASSMADRHVDELNGLPFNERLQGLLRLLSEEGFEAEIEQMDDHILIRELSCPYFRIGVSHPEICVIDQTFIANALSVPVERVACLLDGDSLCTFSIQTENLIEVQHSHD
jgi:predicted ArsR family transcriptional regulator